MWDDRDHTLWWVDVPRGLVHHTHFPSGHSDTVRLRTDVGAVALTRTSDLVVAYHDGFGLLKDRALEERLPVLPVVDGGLLAALGAALPASREMD